MRTIAAAPPGALFAFSKLFLHSRIRESSYSLQQEDPSRRGMGGNGTTQDWPKNACYGENGRDYAHVFAELFAGHESWCNDKNHSVYSQGTHSLKSAEYDSVRRCVNL